MLVMHGAGNSTKHFTQELCFSGGIPWHLGIPYAAKNQSAKTRELFFNVFHAEPSKRAYHRLPPEHGKLDAGVSSTETADEIQKPY